MMKPLKTCKFVVNVVILFKSFPPSSMISPLKQPKSTRTVYCIFNGQDQTTIRRIMMEREHPVPIEAIL